MTPEDHLIAPASYLKCAPGVGAAALGAAVRGLPHTALDLSRSELTALTRAALAPLDPTQLKFAIFRSGYIASIEPDALATLPELTSLDLGYNGLTTVGLGDFRGLSRLRWLRLTANAIGTIEDGAFGSLTAVTHLYLDRNVLTTLLPGAFAGVGSSGQPEQAGQRLRVLYLGYNRLVTPTCETWIQLPELEMLALNGNRIEAIQDQQFNHSNLRTLWLHANQIRTVGDNPSWYPRLEHLDLSRNMLTEMPVSMIHPAASTLAIVKLGHNGIRAMKDDDFAGLPALLRAELHDNYILGCAVEYRSATSSWGVNCDACRSSATLATVRLPSGELTHNCPVFRVRESGGCVGALQAYLGQFVGTFIANTTRSFAAPSCALTEIFENYATLGGIALSFHVVEGPGYSSNSTGRRHGRQTTGGDGGDSITGDEGGITSAAPAEFFVSPTGAVVVAVRDVPGDYRVEIRATDAGAQVVALGEWTLSIRVLAPFEFLGPPPSTEVYQGDARAFAPHSYFDIARGHWNLTVDTEFFVPGIGERRVGNDFVCVNHPALSPCFARLPFDVLALALALWINPCVWRGDLLSLCRAPVSLFRVVLDAHDRARFSQSASTLCGR